MIERENDVYEYFSKYNTIRLQGDNYTYYDLERSIHEDEKKLKIREINLEILENGINEKLEKELDKLESMETHGDNDMQTITPKPRVKKLEKHEFSCFLNTENLVRTGFLSESEMTSMMLKRMVREIELDMRDKLYKLIENEEVGHVDKFRLSESKFVHENQTFQLYSDSLPIGVSREIETKPLKLLNPNDVLITERDKFIFYFDTGRFVEKERGLEFTCRYYLDIIGEHLLYHIE